MAWPTMTLRVAFTTAPFAASPSWSDISSDFLFANIKRGRQHELDRIEAAVATILLDNSSGDFYPDNTGGSYSPNVRSRKRLNIRATYGGTPYDLFDGYVERWKPLWRGRGGKAPVTEVVAVGLIKNLARLLLNNAGYAAETTDNRIDAVLDELSSNIGRDLNTGQTTLLASGALSNVNAMDHLWVCQQSEQGIMFEAGDGDIQFHDRHARLKSPYNTSQATFGTGGGDMKFTAVEFSRDDTFVYNDIRIERRGGTEQTASDATSITNYGQSTLQRDNLEMPTDAEAQSQADYLLKRYKDDGTRVQSITVKPERDPANLWPKVLGYDLSTRITLDISEVGIDSDFHIEGVEHNLDAQSREWETKWQLSDADSQQYWAIGVAGFSEIGETTYVCY